MSGTVKTFPVIPYELQSEDEAAFEMDDQTVMDVPKELVPIVRELIAKHKGV
ncbi:MAG: hypothetical protein GY775_21030 [Candidatus Scalindua sp.]|nr:hypothetical protein [Candidatus Scalindua sp.]